MKKFAFALSAGLLTGGLNGPLPAMDEEPAAASVTQEVNADESAPADDESAASEATATAEADEETEVAVTADDDGNAYSIEVHSAIESDDEDGDEGDKPKVRSRARVYVVGPDGKRKEYELDGSEAQAFQLKLGEGGQEEAIRKLREVLIMKEGDGEESVEVEGVELPAEEERFMIGVQCEEVGEALRTQLKLGEHGLIVMDVRDETPAKEAGLQKFDVIVAINEKDLASRDDLVTSVTDSEGNPLALTIIRQGEKQTVSVTPRKMKVPVVMAPAIVEGFHIGDDESLDALPDEALESLPEDIRKMLHDRKGSFKLRRVHPGVIIEGEMPKDAEAVKKMVERMKLEARDAMEKANADRKDARKAEEEAEEQARMAEKHARKAHADAQAHAEKLHETLIHMQKQLAEMQAQMEKLEQKLQEERPDDN